MRSLYTSLKPFEEVVEMTYCSDFDRIKALLEYVHEYVKPFSRLHFRSGHEDIIADLLGRFQTMFLEEELIDTETFAPLPKAHARLRRILIFLLANTDATYKYNLRQYSSLGHIFEICPLIPKFIFISLVWGLQLDMFFYELLSYAPNWLTFQYFEAATGSLTFIDDQYDVLEKVEQLVRALLMSMTIAHRAKINHNIVEQKILFGKCESYAMNLLRQFFTPDAEKLKNFRKQELFRYSGYALKHILQLVIFAFDVYEKPDTSTVPVIDTNIYDFKINNDTDTAPMSQNLEELIKLAKEEQLRIINTLLNSLENNVIMVRLDVFISWVEVDVEKSNLQSVIGEMAYAVNERIAANKAFEHSVVSVLKTISIRPKTIEEIIAAANLGEMLTQIDDPNLPQKERIIWLNALFERASILGNNECLQTLHNHMNIMTAENCCMILDHMKLTVDFDRAERNVAAEKETYMEEVEMEEFDQLRLLLLGTLQNLRIEQKIKVLKHQTELFGLNSRICCTSWMNFRQRSTEFFNKSISTVDVDKFLILCFESPLYIWMTFTKIGCENTVNMEHFCSIMLLTRSYSDLFLHSIIDALLKNDKLLQSNMFPKLFCRIFFDMYTCNQRARVLKEFICDNALQWLESENYDSMLPILRALNNIASHDDTQSGKTLNFGEATAPVLILAAHLMDEMRWDIMTYMNIREEIVQECIQLIKEINKKFLPIATDRDRNWVAECVKTAFRPMTQFYFQKYSLSPDKEPLKFDQYLLSGYQTVEDFKMETFWNKYFVCCTVKETEWLAGSKSFMPYVSRMMLNFFLNEIDSETVPLNSCNNCLCNYANIVKNFILPFTEDVIELQNLVVAILKVIQSVPQPIYDTTFIKYEGILMDVASKRAISNTHIESIEAYLVTMPDCQGKEIFAANLSALKKP